MSRALNIIGIAATLAMLLVGTVYAESSQPKMVGSQWAVYGETTLPNGNLHFYPGAHATTTASGVAFEMPDATAASPAYVNYLLNTYQASLTEGSTISATINVDTSSASTAFAGNPDGIISTGPFVRLFIQSNLPEDGSATCVGGHKNVANYWWADVNAYTFATGGGGMTMTVPLNPADWSNICGKSGSSNTAAFDQAIANIKYVGLSFGSGYFFANGGGVDGTTGSATFELNSYTITP